MNRALSTLTYICLTATVATVSAQVPASYNRDTCIKARPGKQAELRAYLNEITIKLGKYRVDSGAVTSFSILEAVVPVGRSARCDYHILHGYAGFPRESDAGARLAEEMKKAGIAGSVQEVAARREAVSELIGLDVWRLRERVGDVPKGGYVRRQLDKIHPGMLNTWLDLEKNKWKPLAEEISKAHGTGWRTATLQMPSGAEQPYNAMTSDIFPTWDLLGKDLGLRQAWNKINPGSDFTGLLDQLSLIRDRPRVEIFRVMEFYRKSN